MRHSFLVCYDIRDSKRLRLVHRICKGYGEPWQYSIFFCSLRPTDRVKLQTELEAVMSCREDQVLIIDLGSNESTARDCAVSIGQPIEEPLQGTVVV